MRNKLLSIVFICVIMLVPLITIIDRTFFNKGKETGNTARMSPIAAVGEFLDDIPFRKAFANLNTKITRQITNAMYINSTQVILGKNDWLFFRETQGDYEHINCFSEAEKERLLEHLLMFRDSLAKDGIEFVIYIAPNKATIYPEYMPDTIFQRDSASKAEDLIEYIRANSDIKVIDPKEELLAAKKVVDLYYKADTHWNEAGGYVGAQVFLRELFGVEDKFTKDMITIYEGEREGDLAKIGNVTDLYMDTTLYQIKPEMMDPSIHIDKKVLCIGDSFWPNMSIHLYKYIENVSYVHTFEFKYADIYEYKPDVVVWELVERILHVYLESEFVDETVY